MSSVLNLLDIPLLPLAHILKTMSIQELLNLSYEQEDIQEFLKKIPIRSGGYKCTLNRHGIIIQMEKQSFTFNWNNDNIPDLLDVFDECFDHFDKVFPGGINKLEVCPIIFSEYIDRIPTECSILSIGEEIELEDIEDEEEYSEETLESLLNQTNFISGLILNASIRFEITNAKLFNVDYLKIRSSEWMTSSSLECLQNKIIHLQNSYLMETEINSFLHNLKNGNGNKRLEVLTIESEEEEVDFTAIVNGLETIVTENQVYSMDKINNRRSWTLSSILLMEEHHSPRNS
uniref:FBA_2 domain-containing protein n=1 Tax=Caenorhabditis tropicalis TaxID=1561998 RepID=A0A1I7T0T2_9PELO